MESTDDDRPWGDLSVAEQDALIAESGESTPEDITVPPIPSPRWAEHDDDGSRDPDDTHVEGVDALTEEEADRAGVSREAGT